MKKAYIAPKGYKTPVRWDLLSNERVLNCIDKLLKGEVISQIKNNCSLSRVGNIINEIRKVTGFNAVENVYIGVGNNQGYILAQGDEVKNRLLQLKDEIKAKIEAKKASE
ncbi:hypothetical protein LNAT_P0305 [Lebetimonas natsushimae]|uniref:Uncharacterized protein n=1 Tax=Lebetimonas natsushimae TaxID=1936991 RepID=A0A292YC87_9BACT|nr:hypothetical protein [Lebetimonas natsushimae]GAX87010.1 hypothetical protein LNAT_P0305 [Lebetimonas natsushimae]